MRAVLLFLATLVAGASFAAMAFADVAGDTPVPSEGGAPPATTSTLDAGESLDAKAGAQEPHVTAPPDVLPQHIEEPPHAIPPPDAPDASSSTTPSDSGFSVGLRIAGGAPFGLAKEGGIADVVDYQLPITVDAGYFLSPKLYVGAYFSYALAWTAGGSASTCPNDPDVSCSANLLRFGVAAEYHVRPERRWDPWVGGSIGYEVLNVTATDSADATGDSNLASALNGIELGARGGFDYKPKPFYGFGPFVELSAGHYWYSAFTVHAWANVGIRLRTNL